MHDTLCEPARLLAVQCADTISFMFALEGIDHVALAVRDADHAARWYIEVLGFEQRHEGRWNGIPIFVGKGQTSIALFPARGDALNPKSRGERIGMLHLAFRATRAEFLRAQDNLKERAIAFSFEDHEISHSIYFKDPDGIALEITTYEVT